LGSINQDKQLVIVEDEADAVPTLFGLYLKPGNVRDLTLEANRRGLRMYGSSPGYDQSREEVCWANPDKDGHWFLVVHNRQQSSLKVTQ
jgi:hypothetical protein